MPRLAIIDYDNLLYLSDYNSWVNCECVYGSVPLTSGQYR
jgi:hypothetical protein